MYLRALLPAAAFLALAASVVSFLTGPSANSRSKDALSESASLQPVIVELFTSEGCSSCPPADSLLRKLSDEQSIDGVQVIALEEHVDYWNHLGWSDPFSSPGFSRRQEDYATTFPDGGVYTPQMIVDGRAQFVGSNATEARNQIRDAASQSKSRLLLAPLPSANPHSRSFEVRLDPATPLPASPHLVFWLAVTEKNLQSSVTAGENSGETLRHAPVVRLLRKLQTIRGPMAEPLHVDFDLGNNWNLNNISVVVFLADSHSYQIFAGGLSSLK